MKKQPVIAVIGAGALGVMFGQRMTQTLGPVSYTHLDVYKRQCLYSVLPANCRLTSVTVNIKFSFFPGRTAQSAADALNSVPPAAFPSCFAKALAKTQRAAVSPTGEIALNGAACAEGTSCEPCFM